MYPMKHNKLWLITFFALLLLGSLSAFAQKSKPKSPPKPPVTQPKSKTTKTTTAHPATSPPDPASANPSGSANDEKKVRDIVAFLEFVLNTLGSGTTSSRDKDVVI